VNNKKLPEMKLYERRELLEVGELLEPEAQGIKLPYRVLRVVNSAGLIIWFGLRTQWEKHGQQWTCRGQKCDEPIYEKHYKTL
jgi:hypothetical protein